ncbi:MAG TPA: hypothetical protein VFH43_06640 [Candidatus Kapabacteria bacterium]|nr:hypothetical protein [Candidatus Kapabacteria bacterium]
MSIRQWFNKAAKSASRGGWVRNAKKKWAEKRARKKERELHRELELLREIDTAMTRKPTLDRMPEPPKPVQELDDDWFAPLPAKP